MTEMNDPDKIMATPEAKNAVRRQVIEQKVGKHAARVLSEFERTSNTQIAETLYWENIDLIEEYNWLNEDKHRDPEDYE